MKVLIIDNSLMIIERLEEMLSGMESITAIQSAVSYHESIRLFKEKKPDVVLMDICLPENESFKLLKEIKKISRKTPVVILSILIDHDIQEQCKSLGADFFFDKYNEYEKIPGTLNIIATNIKVESNII